MQKNIRLIVQTRIIYIITTIFLVVLSIYAFTQIKTLIDSSDLVTHTNKVNLSLQKISTAVVDAETNQRGYLLSGDSLLLKKRDFAFTALSNELNTIDSLIKDNPQQQQGLIELHHAIDEKLASMKKVLAEYTPLRVTDKFKAKIIEGVSKMDEIKKEISKMSGTENQLLQQRTKRYFRLSFITPYFVVVLFLGALLILFVSYLRINNALNLAQQLQNTIAQKVIELEKNKLIEASEKELKSLIKQAPVAITLLEGENLIAKVANETALQLMGKTEQEVINKSISDFFPDLPERQSMYKEVFRTGISYQGKEVEISIKRNGETYTGYYDLNHVPWYGNEGTIKGVMAVGLEVTDKVFARKKIEASEERFRSLIQTLPQLVWVTDEKGNLEFVSFRWKEFTGTEPANEQEWKAIMHPDDYDNMIAAWMHSLNTGNNFMHEVRIKSREGEFRWHSVKGEPVRDKDGAIIKWVGAFTDIHTEKIFSHELEMQVAQRTAELKASEEKFYSLFNLSPVCKALSEASSGRIIMINDAFTNTFGYSREDVFNKTSVELGMIGPQSREEIVTELKTKGRVLNKEMEFIKKSGEKFFALTSAEIINVGDKSYYLGAYNDISDRKTAERHIEQKNIELEKMNKELQSFAYISSHDLQEPLRKIQTFATHIIEKEKDNLSENAKEQFERIQKAAKRMQTLIEDLLAYSRTSTLEAKFEKIDLKKIVEEVKEDLREDLIQQHAIIELTATSEINIIPFQFRQLLHNLIGNSLKFASPGQPPHITITNQVTKGIHLNNGRLSLQNKYCHISVSDNGIGFEQQYSEKIFEVFQRLHVGNDYKGTGIGLSIVKKIVENHKGTITAEGEPGKGAKFDIYIPAS